MLICFTVLKQVSHFKDIEDIFLGSGCVCYRGWVCFYLFICFEVLGDRREAYCFDLIQYELNVLSFFYTRLVSFT